MLFGIIALTAVGLSWTLAGVVMGEAPKKGLLPEFVQLLGGLVSMAAGLAIMLVWTGWPALSERPLLWAFGTYTLSGAFNFTLLQLMSYAMQRGPNGIIWTIIQSAMIFPFLTGVLFFGEKLTGGRVAGLALILGALVLFGLAKDNQSRGGRAWLGTVFLAFLVTGIQQILETLPSYFESARNLSSIARTFAMGLDTVLAALVWTLRGMNAAKAAELKTMLHSRYLWLFVGALQLFGLFFSYLLLYPGMDAMAKAGVGGLSYPLLIGSCIVGFALYSAFLIREKTTLLQYAALAAALVGIIGLSLPF